MRAGRSEAGLLMEGKVLRRRQIMLQDRTRWRIENASAFRDKTVR